MAKTSGNAKCDFCLSEVLYNSDNFFENFTKDEWKKLCFHVISIEK